VRLTRLSALFYLSFVGMELSYLYLLGSLMGGPIYALVVMLLPYPLALFSRVALPRLALAQRLRLALEVALVTLVILLVVGEQLIAGLASGQVDALGIVLRMGFCGLAWFLGRTAPYGEVSYSSIAFRLQIGVVAVLVFSQLAGSVPLVFLFFLLAPLALFLARWTSSFSRGATALRSPNVSHLLLAGASVLVPGMALVVLFSPGVARAIVSWLGGGFWGLSDWLDARHEAAADTPSSFNFDFGCSARAPDYEGTSSPTGMSPPAGGPTGISPVAIWIVASIIGLAILTLIAIVVVFALRRQRAGREARPIEPVRFQTRMVASDVLRSLMSLFPQLMKKLWLWLRSLLQRWKRRPGPSDEALLSIRALYRSLSRWAARQGMARAPAQTPLEHLKLLEQRFPQQQDVLKQVTEAYLVARYSQKPVSHDVFHSAKEAWQRAVAHHTRLRFRT